MDANPVLEKVLPAPGTSFLVKHYDEPAKRANKVPSWHYHPELELVYVRGGHGRRQVGGHVSHFTNGELILMGANLPHMGFTDRMTGNEKETVVQFSAEFPSPNFQNLPEFEDIKDLIRRARNGLSFSGRVKTVQGDRLERLIELPPLDRMLLLIDILQRLALTEDYENLNAEGFHLQIETHGYERFNSIQTFIGENFQREINLDEMARVASMTVPAFCRYFKKATGRTFVNYLTETRVVFACKLLADGHTTIQAVAYDSGFQSVSQFNRAFKRFAGRTPSEYRSALTKKVMPLPDLKV